MIVYYRVLDQFEGYLQNSETWTQEFIFMIHCDQPAPISSLQRLPSGLNAGWVWTIAITKFTSWESEVISFQCSYLGAMGGRSFSKNIKFIFQGENLPARGILWCDFFNRSSLEQLEEKTSASTSSIKIMTVSRKRIFQYYWLLWGERKINR